MLRFVLGWVWSLLQSQLMYRNEIVYQPYHEEFLAIVHYNRLGSNINLNVYTKGFSSLMDIHSPNQSEKLFISWNSAISMCVLVKTSSLMRAGCLWYSLSHWLFIKCHSPNLSWQHTSSLIGQSLFSRYHSCLQPSVLSEFKHTLRILVCMRTVNLGR